MLYDVTPRQLLSIAGKCFSGLYRRQLATYRYGPGVFNLDLSLAKDFRFTEHKSLELRVETFNTLNHFNPNNPNSETVLKETQAAARILGVQLHVVHATTERDIEMVVADWAQLRAGPLVIGSDGLTKNY